MDFSSLSPAPPPSAVSDAALHLAGPGSIGPEELYRGLGAIITRETRVGEEVAALVVGTSGSTGRPKKTVLSAQALRSSGLATEVATGTDGGAHWLLALPVHYVAGAQVVARSILAGTRPVTTESIVSGSHFTARDFLDAVDRLGAGNRMTSLVPTQVHALLEEVESGAVPETDMLEALRSFDAILLGGAPASSMLLSRCDELRIPLVLTYGSAETAGGCIYDSHPLPGTRIAIEPSADESGAGRIWLGGPTLASGYLEDGERTAESFRRDPEGVWWYRTDDLGRYTPESGLRVMGRADDVVMTGGVKVSARAVARVLEEDPTVREAIVVGVESPQWGQEIRAAVSRRPERDPDAKALTELVRQRLGPAAAPKEIVVLDQLPQASTGKPDQAAVRRLLEGSSVQ